MQVYYTNSDEHTFNVYKYSGNPILTNKTKG